MKHIIVGTAGHIDHGKTALVKALTGIDADRLEEEKRRGITIDLGFAHLQLTPSLRLGFVDVPGHERFIKNMLAGVGGIDLVLFVIAADESIKPQTREHFDICRLLEIPRGVIALTKADLVDDDILGLVRIEVEQLVAGSFLEGAPIVPVSSVTGAGLEELRQALARVAAEAPEKDASGHFRLPIDRVFTVKGFGTVATGTLVSGSVAKEQEVELYPAGRRLRVRGVQVHGTTADRAVAGQRTAVNLADIEPAGLARGDVLSEPGVFRAVKQVDCRLQLLPTAKPLKHRAPVHFHSGTAEIEAQVRLLEGTAPLQPGGAAYVRLLLRDAALLLPADRFIIRMFSPVVTIGGGVVLDVACGADALVALLPGWTFWHPRMRRNASRCSCERRPSAWECPTWWHAPGWWKPKLRRPRRALPSSRLRSHNPGTWIVRGSTRPAAGWSRRFASFTARTPCNRESPSWTCAPRERRHSCSMPCSRTPPAKSWPRAIRCGCGAIRWRSTRTSNWRARPSSVHSDRRGWRRPWWRTCWRNRASSRRGHARCCRSYCATSFWCASTTSWSFTTPPSQNCGGCWKNANRRASTWERSNSGPEFRANTPSRCWNSSIASESRAAREKSV